MPDYIYLLENRLSLDQQQALRQIRQTAQDAGMTVFLTGGAVRDLTSGSPVHDLDVSVHGNALKLKRPLEKAGAVLWGEHDPTRTLFFRFPKSVRVEISSTRTEDYPKPGKPVYHWASMLDDLRRRDFTANAMALSLNEGSYGLLMDPMNGVADIEARQLRLVSNYGFLEEPARLLRATRLTARLAYEMDERTKARYDNAREEGVISALSSYYRGYELEEIGHEEDGLRVLKAMQAEGWMQALCAAWTPEKADVNGLAEMHRVLMQLQMQGVNPDPSTASLKLLTAKMSPKEIAGLQKLFINPGFVTEWNSLEARAKEFAKQLLSKEAATPSATWKLFTSADPEAVLWLGLTSKSAPVQQKYTNFFTVWPEAKQKVPHLLMQEMRITPELEGYVELLQKLFFNLIDGKLETDEQMRAFLEPYSPPAPPPPVTLRRSRGARKVERRPKLEELEAEEVDVIKHELDDEAVAAGHIDEEEEEEEDGVAAPARRPVSQARSGPGPVKNTALQPKPAGKAAAATPVDKTVAAKATPAKTAAKTASAPAKAAVKSAEKPKTVAAPPAKTAPATKAAGKAAAAPQKGGKPEAKPEPKPAAKAVGKVAAKPAGKSAVKTATKAASKSAARPASKSAGKAAAGATPRSAAKPAKAPAAKKAAAKPSAAKKAPAKKAPAKAAKKHR